MSRDDRQSTLVLCYHAVSPNWPDPIAVKPAELERQLAFLRGRGFVGTTFSKALGDPPGPRTLAVTFDDGYRSVLEHALPILERLEMPGTVFIPSSYADSPQPEFWSGTGQQRWFGGPHEPELRGLSWEDLRWLIEAGWEIGSHSRSHRHLTRLDHRALLEELLGSREDCERGTGKPCLSVAYPYGDVDERVHRVAAQAGYRYGGALPRRFPSAPSALGWPRIGVYGPDGWLRFRLKVSPLMPSLRRSAAWKVIERLRPSRTREETAAPMRVLMVNHTANFSGAEVALLSLVEGLGESCECAVACPPAGPFADRLRSRGIEQHRIAGTDASLRLHPFKTPRALAGLLRSAVQVRRAARRHRADIIHANSLRSGLIAAMAPGLKVPLIVQSHDHLPPGRVGRIVRRVIAARADKVIGVTQRTADNFNQGLAEPIAECVYISIDRKRFRPSANGSKDLRAELGIPEQAFLLAQVAQITPWKGQKVAIEALDKVMKAQPDREVHLLLVGEVAFGSGRYDNRAYAGELHGLVSRLDLRPRVHFLGRRADVPALMEAADLTLLPSWNEPFGLVAAESMAVGTPVLVSSESGVSEYVEDGVGGLLLPAGEPARWAEAIVGLMDADPDRLASMGEKARSATDRFTEERYASDVSAVYREAMPRPVG